MSSASGAGVYSFLDDERLKLDFFTGLGRGLADGFASMISPNPMSSDTEVEYHAWLGTTPQLRLWEGEALLKELPNYKAFLANQEFEASLRIGKADFRRDKTGQISRQIGKLGSRGATHWDQLLSDLITAGETASGATVDNFRDLSGRAYDNQAFFDTDHDESGTNQTNDLTVTEVPSADVVDTAVPTAIEMEGIITETIGRMYSITDDQGEPTNGNLRDFIVMVGNSTYWSKAKSAIGSAQLDSGQTNTLAGMIEAGDFRVRVIFNPRLSSSATKIYMFGVGNDIGPFIMQEEVPLDVEQEDPGITSKHIIVSAQATRSAGYGLWQHAALVTLS